jgi:hypothetical protein
LEIAVMAQQEEFESFKEFWPHYVAEHSKPATRALHLAGTSLALGCAAALLAKGKWKLLPLALVPGYGAAWVGHFFIERNRPATFKYPLWSFMADYKMIAFMLAGRMEAEVERAVERSSGQLPDSGSAHP